MSEQSLPIGVFDSGMGGLTVLAQLRKQLPNENFLYLGDTARLPYGTKSELTVNRYAQQAAGLLVSQGVKALVIACNTASAFALDQLRQTFRHIPVFGVVDPGADAATQVAQPSGVVVLATQSTILGGAYQRALTARAPLIPVYGRSCPLWVTLAEMGPQAEQFTEAIIGHDMRGFGGKDAPTTILLGCTHFPVFSLALGQYLTKVGSPCVNIVDSASTTASVVAQKMDHANLLTKSSTAGTASYFATDGAERFKQVGQYFLGSPIDAVALVDL